LAATTKQFSLPLEERDRYEPHEVICASSETAGTAGKERVWDWHRADVATGMVTLEGKGET
jgi:hypothetical protein